MGCTTAVGVARRFRMALVVGKREEQALRSRCAINYGTRLSHLMDQVWFIVRVHRVSSQVADAIAVKVQT